MTHHYEAYEPYDALLDQFKEPAPTDLDVIADWVAARETEIIHPLQSLLTEAGDALEGLETVLDQFREASTRQQSAQADLDTASENMAEARATLAGSGLDKDERAEAREDRANAEEAHATATSDLDEARQDREAAASELVEAFDAVYVTFGNLGAAQLQTPESADCSAGAAG